MKTLYISDLDGTLLNRQAELSPRSRVLLSELLQDNASITFATARSLASVRPILSGVPLSLPVVLMNGVCIYDMQAERYLKRVTIPQETALRVCELLSRFQLPAFLYRIDDSGMTCFHPRLDSPAMQNFCKERKERYDKPFEELADLRDAVDESTVYFTMVGSRERVYPFYEAVQALPGLQLAYYKDVYSEDDWYLEIFGAAASKYHAVQFLRCHGSFDRAIAFGDNMNDIPMFDACDECYAVSNAQEKVRQRANGVIGSNVDDAVPTWIYNHYYHIIISEGANWL